MPAVTFQIRVCKNPECGLRYPLLKDSPFGERCPVCLGETIPVLERPIAQQTDEDKSPLSTSIHLYVLLDNIRSALNVGSIFRSADGFNFNHIYLCGITPTPDLGEVRKSAVGAEKYVKWSSHKNAVELINSLKNLDYEIWALEKTRNSMAINTAIANFHKPKRLLLVVGNEITGVDPGILEIADHTTHLPMRGQKRSFNVAVAFAIAAQIINSWN
jgi:tRNA G18 (ribose-2'-O)-methylase SpoU